MNPNPLLALNHFTVPCSLTDVLTLFLSYLCFSTASSRNAKEAASWNLQPLQSNLKVLQEQQTQPKDNMLSGQGPVESVLTVCMKSKKRREGEKSHALRREMRSRGGTAVPGRKCNTAHFHPVTLMLRWMTNPKRIDAADVPGTTIQPAHGRALESSLARTY
jgi:hypothetical protein